jgi:subtilisin family serine protease
MPPDNAANGGADVIVGIVDFGLDFVHRNFQNKEGDTRVLALWDQKATTDKEHRARRGPSRTSMAEAAFKQFNYGKLFLKEEIDAALESDHPYAALGYEPPRDSSAGTGAHGTYVTDVAAGNGLGAIGAPGVAPRADIIFVDLSTAGTPLQGPQSVGHTFGDSNQLMDAIRFIFDAAGHRPCVVNLSLGTYGGPHDGTSLVEKAIDQMASEKPNRAVVVAAGNFFGEDVHVSGHVPHHGHVDLRWMIRPHDLTSNELEVWYSGEDSFTAEVLDPAGNRVAFVHPGKTAEKADYSPGLLTIVNHKKDPNNNDNVINIFFERGLRDGIWTLRLHGDSVRNGHFHAWIERDQYGQSRFVEAADRSYQIANEHTLGSIACGAKSIVVGAYDANDPRLPLSNLSSSGPTRDGRCKPEISAPGEMVLAARSGTVVLRHRFSGTSIAAAAVTGTVALMLAEANARGVSLSIDQIRDILIRTARKDPSMGDGWHSRLGYGRVCAADAVAAVRELGSNSQQARQEAPAA